MFPKRYIFFVGILLMGIFVLWALISSRTQTPLGRSFEPLFRWMGKGTKTADRILGKVLPIDQIDEKVLGEAIRARNSFGFVSTGTDQAYVQRLLNEASSGSRKPFSYSAHIVSGSPNAFALPGGVVVVTTGLLVVLQSEAELFSVIGHEVGHIELGHCFDSVKFEMAAKKLGGRDLGQIADFVYGTLSRTTFSKTQESEADQYGFSALLEHEYSPFGMSSAFQKMQAGMGASSGILRDYFTSHPPMELRIENYKERATRWRAGEPQKKMYVGKQNFIQRKARSESYLPTEVEP